MAPYDLFLNKDLSKYKHHDLVRKDMRVALESYSDLHPKMEGFTFNDGKTQSLACLEGTIPVMYQGSSYNIPIGIFMREDHPYSAPMVYVRPTSTMHIKASAYVENTGCVKLPYLSEWSYPQSDLVGLVAVLQVVFGEKPPVFSKPTLSSQPSYPSNPTTAYPYNAAMPMPTGGALPFAMGPGLSPANGTASMPYLPAMGSAWVLPPPPSGPQTSQLRHTSSANFLSGRSSPVVNHGGMNPALGGQPYNTNTITEEHLRLSMRSAVMDKLRHIQREVMYQHQDELQSLRQTQADLKKGEQTLRSMMNEMQTEQERVTIVTSKLEEANSELEELLTRLRSSDKEAVDVDEAVNATAPLYRQLVSAFAEEQAIEDAIYQLGEAVGKDVLDVELFLKKARELSRKQFMLRSVVQLCREKAGLPSI